MENYERNPAFQIAEGYSITDYVRDGGKLPEELKDDPEAQHRLKRLQKRFKMKCAIHGVIRIDDRYDIVDSAMAEIVKMVNDAARAMNKEAGKEVVPVLPYLNTIFESGSGDDAREVAFTEEPADLPVAPVPAPSALDKSIADAYYPGQEDDINTDRYVSRDGQDYEAAYPQASEEELQSTKSKLKHVESPRVKNYFTPVVDDDERLEINDEELQEVLAKLKHIKTPRAENYFTPVVEDVGRLDVSQDELQETKSQLKHVKSPRVENYFSPVAEDMDEYQETSQVAQPASGRHVSLHKRGFVSSVGGAFSAIGRGIFKAISAAVGFLFTLVGYLLMLVSVAAGIAVGCVTFVGSAVISMGMCAVGCIAGCLDCITAPITVLLF
jgi:hypothetical protein